MERAELRQGFRKIFALASYGNRRFQAGEPWKTRKTDPEAADRLLMELAYVVRDLAVMIEPYIPQTSARILRFLGQEGSTWEVLGDFSGLKKISSPEILFERLEDDLIKGLRERFAGSQADRAEKEKERKAMEETEKANTEEQFTEAVDLRIAKITAVERHPEADKLYIETIDAGEEEERQIVSGLVPFYEEEELLNKNIILVYNLKPAKLRGVKSQGMLLAAEKAGDEDHSSVEVLFVDEAAPGTRAVLDGYSLPETAPKKVKIDDFFKIPMSVKDNTVMVGSAALTVNGKPVTTRTVAQGKVG
jgi:methionyl-tRNA synthetase